MDGFINPIFSDTVQMPFWSSDPAEGEQAAKVLLQTLFSEP